MDTLKLFEQFLCERDASPLRVNGYVADLQQFAAWFTQTNAEAFSPQAITPTDVREYKQFLQVIGRRKANTVNRKLAALAIFSQWAMQTGQITADPTANVKSVKQTNLAPKWLDKSEQFALQRAIERDLQLSKLRFPKRWVTRRRDASLTTFLLNTGLRLNESVSLRLSDVQISERKGSVLVHQGKGNKQRAVPLNAEARAAIQAWLSVRPTTGSDFLWVAVEAEATAGMSGRAVQRILKRYAQEAGLAELTPHIARHTFAKNLVNQGVGLEKVAALMGHASLNTTRVYVTPDTRDLECAVEKLEK